jgi:hypothetical protein
MGYRLKHPPKIYRSPDSPKAATVKDLVNTESNAEYFNNLISNMTRAANKVRSTFEGNINVDQVSECHYAENTDFDKGNIWCYVNQAYYVTPASSSDAEANAKKLLDSVRVNFQAIGLNGSAGDLTYSIDGKRLINSGGQFRDERTICGTDLLYPSSKFVPYYLPEHTNASDIQFIISCGSRSPEKVFPFKD